MRISAAVIVLAISLTALPVQGQNTWQYVTFGVPDPKASMKIEEYEIGAFCRNETLYFFAGFPREGMPKTDAENAINFKFATDTPDDTNIYSVSLISRGWQRDGDRAGVWFWGVVADDWIERMIAARKDVFIAVETNEDEPELVFERWFPVRGSTSTLRSLMIDCST